MERFAPMQEILDALADPVVLVDDRRDICAANSATRALFPGDLIGRNIALSIRHPDILEAVESVLNGGSNREVEVTLAGAVAVTYRVRVAALNRTMRPVILCDRPIGEGTKENDGSRPMKYRKL